MKRQLMPRTVHRVLFRSNASGFWCSKISKEPPGQVAKVNPVTGSLSAIFMRHKN